MRFLRLNSVFLFLLGASCANPYKQLQEVPQKTSTALRFKPQFGKELYRCVVDGKFLFKKFHLSGLLFFKSFEDGSTRAIFQNEMGISFFDFKWDDRDSFEVVSIMPQLDKPALVKILQKDFNLVLMKGLRPGTEGMFRHQKDTVYRFSLDKGYAYYLVQKGGLTTIDNAGKRRSVTTIDLGGKDTDNGMPRILHFTHHRANFTIHLNKIDSDGR